MKGLLGRIRRFLLAVWGREPWLAEAWSAVVAVGWGMVALSSGYDLSDNVPLAMLVRLNPDLSAWAVYAMVAGLLQAAALVADRRLARWAASVVASWFSTTVVISFVINAPLTPTVALYAGWAGINLFGVFRHLRRLV